jgi:hypothetical protein
LYWDEEPAADVTDLSLLQAAVVVTSTVAVLAENTSRAGRGLYVPKDRLLGLMAHTTFNSMSAYFGLISFGFFAHSMSPLMVSHSDPAAAYSAYASKFGGWMVASLMIILGSLLSMGGWERAGVRVSVAVGTMVWAAVSVVEVWGCGVVVGGAAPSNPSSSALAFPTTGPNGFAWSKSRPTPHPFLFVDASALFCGLVLGTVCASSVFLIATLAVFHNPNSSEAAVVTRALEASGVAVCSFSVSGALLGARLGWEVLLGAW